MPTKTLTISILVISLCLGLSSKIKAQNISGPGGYKVIYVGSNNQGDFTRSLLLLHEAYNGTVLPFNLAVGTITASRGDGSAFLRMDIAQVNTAAAYNYTYGAVQSTTGDLPWKLKTCIYNGKKYIALEVPYNHSFHSNGFQFEGWTSSSGENLKIVNYEVGGSPVNQNLISNILDFTANLNETHSAAQINLMSNVNIGTTQTNPAYQLQVKGKVRAQEVMVENQNWPDFVFSKDHVSMSLPELEKYITLNKHLPEIPSAAEVKSTGVSLSDMNAKLLQKIEELTLYIIELRKDSDLNTRDIAAIKLKEN